MVPIPKVDEQKDLSANEILNPSNNQYGKVTKILAIDCEMDHCKPPFDFG
jgi:hypothetical protein